VTAARPRILIAKMGQDGHDRGQKVIAIAFADSASTSTSARCSRRPTRRSPAGVENDVHIVGASSLAAGHLTLVPTAGDELQAIKRGIVELADVVLYNKAELDPAGAERAMGQMRAALGVVRGAGELPPVLGVSAATGAGVEAAWQAVAARHGALVTRGQLDDKRRHQAVAWMDAQIDDAVRARLLGNAAVVAERERVAAEVAAGHLDPGTAAAAVIERMFG
jgi:methylmalonyl-CoA mutase cobalamin-binding domain/chain